MIPSTAVATFCALLAREVALRLEAACTSLVEVIGGVQMQGGGFIDGQSCSWFQHGSWMRSTRPRKQMIAEDLVIFPALTTDSSKQLGTEWDFP